MSNEGATAVVQQHDNLISEGALSHLINSHINEGDAVPITLTGTGGGPNANNSSIAQNDSFENGTNLAFWTRK